MIIIILSYKLFIYDFFYLGSRAVDALLTSPFATREVPLFKTREEICDYLHIMLIHKFFHRARKVPVDENELKGKKGKKKDKEKEKKAESGEDEKDKNEKNKGTDAESSVVEGSKDQKVNIYFLFSIKMCFYFYLMNYIHTLKYQGKSGFIIDRLCPSLAYKL